MLELRKQSENPTTYDVENPSWQSNRALGVKWWAIHPGDELTLVEGTQGWWLRIATNDEHWNEGWIAGSRELAEERMAQVQEAMDLINKLEGNLK